LEEGLEKISEWNIQHLFITLGAKGACGVMNGEKVFVPAPKVNAIDPTGAGDAFMSGLLYGFHEFGMPESVTDLTPYLEFANRVGAEATTQIGSLTSTLDLTELRKNFLKGRTT
jgi:fructokinase